MGAFYTVHDAEDSRVGFAVAKGTSSTILSGSNPIVEYLKKIITSIIEFLKSILGLFGL